MTSSTEDLRSIEAREKLPLFGRRVLITGGATGLGLAVAKNVSQDGAEVIIGTRSSGHFESAAGQIDGEVIPFVADITKSEEVKSGFDGLVEEDKFPTDIILSAAGGMEPFMELFMRDLIRLKKMPPEEVAASVADLKKRANSWVAESLDFAKRVNFSGPRTFSYIAAYFADKPYTLIYFSSLPSSFFDEVEPPSFYRGVAQTKHAFEDWMTDHYARTSMVSEVYPAIVSGSAIADSMIGKVTQKYLMPLMSPEERDALAATFISNADMVTATRMLLDSDPTRWGNYPKRLFVTGPGKISERVEDNDPVLAVKSPL